MFETNAQFLSVIGDFAVVGFFLGILYDIVRFFRTALGTGKIFRFISDFVIMIISGLIVFYHSLDTPTGNIRIIYVFAATAGMVFYLITIGKITAFIARLLGRLISLLKTKIKSTLYKPVISTFNLIKQKLTSFFSEIRQKMLIYKEKSHFCLKKTPSMMYNKNNKISELYPNGGEERNVIKAKVRKKA